MMHVIIKGACHVRIKRIGDEGQITNPVVATLYDG